MTRVPLTSYCAYQPEGSAWQGGTLHETPERGTDNAAADLLLNAILARMTNSVSPAALATAWFDWASHLLLAPSKQQELFVQGTTSVVSWLRYAAEAVQPHCDPCQVIEPLAQDRRFADPGWQRWPYNVLSQGFLLQQQWWHHATMGVRGVSPHHSEVITFVARQLLDCAAPSNFVLTNPVVQAATLQAGGMNLLSGAMRAAVDASKALGGTPADSAFMPGRDVAITPGKVVLRNELIELLRYDPVTPQVHATPLLIVPAWIMKYYILDLSPHNSLVRYLVGKGHTVFMISWKNPQADDRDLGMEDYRRLGVMAAIDAICAQTGAASVNACGYCLGGTLLSIAAAAMARDGDDRLASVTLLAAQVDFTEPGELSLFIDESEVSYLEAAMWSQGYLDTRQMAGAFQLLRSNDLIWSRRLKHYLLNLPDRDTDLMAWNADATRMPYRMHSEYLRQLFLHNDLAHGRYQVDGRPVALTDVEVPMFAVGTLTDHVAPWRSVYKIVLLADTDVTFLLTSGGHNVGVVAPPDSGKRSYQIATHSQDTAFIDAERWHACVPVVQGSWWPAWEAWLADQAGPLMPPPPASPALDAAPGRYVLQP
ncbi:polyhydroxyalkanoate synthase [Pseudoduganella flava]|uniref:Alpha/beta fold hydrolase n=1 Tax=Pseudoduganella flava TaxID=871742 RepID=A0A562PQS1_9BURK|nr:alpha/beta fold hydrolase [Pseudoduganella flava]QGZ37922.1 alpha/beta fold hydrolase [Pseudoduganella flava]TWI46759.1 polyhydroxyalkanoate synthase [Pseudoduganella flava]